MRQPLTVFDSKGNSKECRNVKECWIWDFHKKYWKLCYSAEGEEYMQAVNAVRWANNVASLIR